VKNTYAKLFSDLNYQNQVLKSVVFGLIALLMIALSAIVIFSYRGPTVVGLSESGEVVELFGELRPKQIEAAIRRYMQLRYNWSKTTLQQQSKLTESMISDSAIPAFRKTIQDLLKFTNGRNVEQRVYAKSIDVDLLKKTVFVQADRVNVIESLKAATELRVVLKFSIGEKTISNPWGIYIEKEAEGDVR